MDEPTEIDEKEPFCPECGSILERDGVSLGDGTDMVYGPWYCIDCDWVQGSDYDDNEELEH